MIKQALLRCRKKWHRTVIDGAVFMVAIGCTFCLVPLISSHSMAQAQTKSPTDFNIKAESPDLKSEFQKELDKWMIRAYEGDRDAQFKVGVLFANDQFGPPDNEQSVYWYQQAARQGHILAQYNLGHLYLTGSGVKRDEKIAMRWWLKAAEQQHALAQFNVGRAYYLGIGLEKDASQAKLWFERASQNQEPKSTEILKQLGWWDPSSVASVTQPTPELAGDFRTEQSTLEPDAEASPAEGLSEKQDNALANTNAETNTTEAGQSDPSSENQTALTQTSVKGKPIAVFTNPSVRNVLITIVDDANVLSIDSDADSWTVVTSAEGFPVWVNKNFIRVSGSTATITADSVNARSVPLITTGSVVGRLNKGEIVSVVAQKDDWFRVTSPLRFKGWVKTTDLKASQTVLDHNKDLKRNADRVSGSPVSGNATDNTTRNQAGVGAESMHAALAELPYTTNNNAWLFEQEENSYALQLASFSEPASVERFLTALPFRNSSDLHLYTTKTSEGDEWIYVVYGNYSSSDDARADSVRLKQKRAWIRRLGVLQQNRCIAWKKELPAPKELNEYCT